MNLSLKIPLSPAVWKLNSVPAVLSDEEFESLHSSFDKNRASGIRDYAITLCFTELGLRCAEVAGLSLDDFDWENSIINIKNTKTHSRWYMARRLETVHAFAVYAASIDPKAQVPQTGVFGKCRHCW